MEEFIVQVKDVSLSYRFIKSLSIKDWFSSMLPGNKIGTRVKIHQALKNISFNVKKGSVVGIIGENGAGKSTLLRVLARVYGVDQGNVIINTDSVTLLTLATGFKSELSGIENIYINGLLLGLSRQQIDEKLNEIIEFSELGEFIQNPIRTYSSGMRSKLAFSIACHVDPELLLIDEVFSVGDARFRKKSSAKIKELIRSDRTVIMVSHNDDIIEELCDEAIWLDKGEIRAMGETKKILREYQKYSNR